MEAGQKINVLLKSEDPGSRLSPGASGEFGSHAIRPRSGHHMQVMTVLVEAKAKLPATSEIRLACSAFVRFDAVHDLGLRIGRAEPAFYLHPFAGLEIFVVFKEMLDLF